MNPNVAGRTADQKARFPGRIYPDELKELELAALRERRAAIHRAYAPAGATPEDTAAISGLPPALAHDASHLPADTTGFALSGGGIRSATFCLGVFQALAELKLLSKVDYLSTVSGGGYFGAYWCGWLDRIQRGQSAAPTADAAGSPTPGPVDNAPPISPEARPHQTFADAERDLANPYSHENAYLRENGRYLAPNGGGDAQFDAAVYLRNLLSIHVVLASLLLGVLCLAVAFRELAMFYAHKNVAFFFEDSLLPLVRTPAWFIPGALAALAAAAGLVYWLPIHLVAEKSETRWRNFWSHAFSNLLGLTLFFAGVAAFDTIGASLFKLYADSGETTEFWVKLGTLAAALFVAANKLKNTLHGLGGETEVKPSLSALAAVAAVFVATLWLLTLSFFANFLVNAVHPLAMRIDSPVFGSFCLHGRLFVPAALLLGLAALLGIGRRFVNLSSLANLYAARLTRAYLGASNLVRRARPDVTRALPGDQLDLHGYFPHRAGGPLHLVNATVNQTADSKSAIVQFDRKGMNLALGPCGVSAGVQHHARWLPDPDKPFLRSDELQAIADDPKAFHLFATEKSTRHAVELLALGEWVGISGAAVSTGLGQQTKPAFSFLLGFLNVRLGWWWNSGIEPTDRRQRAKTAVRWNRGDILSKIFGTQFQLLDEMRAHFCGPARRHWYLTDGGHFENTAAYELIRRRVPLIIVCDDGCDVPRQLGDFANLIRKARLDFDAEITLYDRSETDQIAAGPLRSLLANGFLTSEAGPLPLPGRPAVLARVHYRDGLDPDSILLLIKPTLTPAEPVDVLNYATVNPPFPQQSTADQFFDEAQWESHRKLGYDIAKRLFGAADPARPLRDSLFPPVTSASA